MLNPIKKLALIALASILAVSAQAFSLLGPFDYWQVGVLDFNGATTFYGGDIGGPQQIGQQYRWNSPRIYYAYDGSFVSYFGASGIKAVEQAIAVFNALPPVSMMSSNLTEFPLDSRSVNLTAEALGILDLKSVAMAEIIEQMGLANADRYVWTPRVRVLPTGAKCPNYDVTTVMRNFDPITWSPSAYVNNVLYGFSIVSVCPSAGDVTDALEQLVDPTAIGASAVSDEASAISVSGVYYTGITRDDAGGLRNLLSKHQVAPLSLPLNATNGTAGGGFAAFTGGAQSGSPWNFVSTITASNSTILGNGSPWTIVIVNSGTNTTNTIIVPGTTITASTNSTALNTAGLEKITFIQVPFDSTLGINFTTFVDSYSLTTFLNGRATSTPVIRIVPSPDFVFQTGDPKLPPFSPTGPGIVPPLIFRTTPVYVNATAVARPFNNGPGIINPQSAITFSSIGPFVENLLTVVLPNGTAGNGGIINYWGSFDGSTNAPIVYPDGLSIQQLEAQLYP